MRWKCFWGHTWREEGRNSQASFRSREDLRLGLAFAMHTLILYKCSTCHKHKIRKLTGDWVGGSPSDDNDNRDGDSPPEPDPLSPDDYYESLTKKNQ